MICDRGCSVLLCSSCRRELQAGSGGLRVLSAESGGLQTSACCNEAIPTAGGSVMQASRQRAQPTHCAASMCGRVPSHCNAPGTGQAVAQAPHSGPSHGRQRSGSIVALARRGGDTGTTATSSFSSSCCATGRRSAPGSQAATQGQSSHRWQPRLDRSRAGVATTSAPRREGKGEDDPVRAGLDAGAAAGAGQQELHLGQRPGRTDPACRLALHAALDMPHHLLAALAQCASEEAAAIHAHIRMTMGCINSHRLNRLMAATKASMGNIRLRLGLGPTICRSRLCRMRTASQKPNISSPA